MLKKTHIEDDELDKDTDWILADAVLHRANALELRIDGAEGLWTFQDEAGIHGPFTDEEAIVWLDHEALAVMYLLELKEVTAQKRMLEIRLAWLQFQPPKKETTTATTNDDLDFVNAELRAIGDEIRAVKDGEANDG